MVSQEISLIIKARDATLSEIKKLQGVIENLSPALQKV